MKVMFVDDEKFVLNGMKRAFYNSNWEIFLANSSNKALEILAEQPIDFIVTEMLLPGLNGADLLEQVRDCYPSTVRIILSGHTDNDLSFRASYLAHQWINKPCEPQLLKIELEKINDVRDDLVNEHVKKLLGGLNRLPTAPKTFIKIKSLLKSKSYTMKDLSLIISEDPSLSAKILQVANTAFFVSSKEVTNIDDAITRLGVEMVSNIVAVEEIYAKIEGVPKKILEEIHNRGLKTAKLAFSIADKPFKQLAMLSGLLHNIGELILCKVAPQHIETYIENREIGADNTYLERSLFEVDSIQVASYLLHLWHFPYTIIESITLQNKVDKLMNREFGPAASLYLARMLINEHEIDTDIVEYFSLSEKIKSWRT